MKKLLIALILCGVLLSTLCISTVTVAAEEFYSPFAFFAEYNKISKKLFWPPEEGEYIIRSLSPDGAGDPFLKFYPDFSSDDNYITDDDSGENGNFFLRVALKTGRSYSIIGAVKTEAPDALVVIERDPGYEFSSVYAPETGEMKLPILSGGDASGGIGMTYLYFCPKKSGNYVFEAEQNDDTYFDGFDKVFLYDCYDGAEIDRQDPSGQSFRIKAALEAGKIYRLQIISYAYGDTDCDLTITQGAEGIGSVLSWGNPRIVIAIGVLAVGGVAALVIVKKKKKPALASGENTDE